MMTVAILALTGLIWLAIFAALGRAVMPPAERVPLRCWRAADVAAAVAIGFRAFRDMHALAHQHLAASSRWS